MLHFVVFSGILFMDAPYAVRMRFIDSLRQYLSMHIVALRNGIINWYCKKICKNCYFSVRFLHFSIQIPLLRRPYRLFMPPIAIIPTKSRINHRPYVDRHHGKAPKRKRRPMEYSDEKKNDVKIGGNLLTNKFSYDILYGYMKNM